MFIYYACTAYKSYRSRFQFDRIEENRYREKSIKTEKWNFLHVLHAMKILSGLTQTLLIHIVLMVLSCHGLNLTRNLTVQHVYA